MPLSLQAKDLNENFARFHFSGASKKDQSAVMRAMSGQINPTGLDRNYFTKGDTLKLESGTYLIAYAPEDRAAATPMDDEIDFGDAVPASPQPHKLRVIDKLLISLLDLRNLGNITDLQPFDAENDMENEADRNRAVVSTLKSLGQHLIAWLEEQDESKWPSWGTIATPEIRQHFNPYAQSEQMWQHPSTGEFFGLNPALAKRDIWEMANRAWVYMAYERRAAADGARAVLFADGHVERVNPDRWKRLIKDTSDEKKALAPTLEQGMSDKQKLILLDQDALLYYLYKKQQAKVASGQSNVQYYLSKNGRIYYRDSKTHQAIWVTPPKQTIYIPFNEAEDYKGLRGYNGDKSGRDLTSLMPK